MENPTSTIIITIVRNKGNVKYLKDYRNISHADILFAAEMLREEILQEIKKDIKAKDVSNNTTTEDKEMD
jgi:hypothetical protein